MRSSTSPRPGCQWRHLPDKYPPWSTVHSYHLDWSRDGTWERVCDRLRNMVRLAEGRDPEPSAGIIDARTVRGASTVTTTHPRHSELTRGYDGNKKISGRKLFGLVDTIGLLVGVRVLAAGVSDNAGGIAVFDLARPKTERLGRVWVDAGFKNAFAAYLRSPAGRCRGRQQDPPGRLPRAAPPLGRRANLVMADEQPPPPSRL